MHQTEHSANRDMGKTFKQTQSFDLAEETLDFKPINEGLGFHKKRDFVAKKAEVPSVSYPRPSKQKGRSSDVAQEVHHPYLQNKKIKSKAAEASLEENELIEEKLELAKPHEMAFAFVVDLAWILIGFSLINFLFMKAAFLSPIEFKVLLLEKNILVLEAALFSVLFLIYFTIVDCSRGLGKSMFSLELRTLTEEKAGLTHSFFRSLISLFSLPLLFLPLILDFQGKISETKVIKSK